MQVEKLSETLYKFTLSQNDFTVNVVASIGPDGILLVDTGWTGTADELNEKIRELSDDTIKLIIFTHQHGDHIGGRGVLGKDATLIAHKSVKDELAGKYFALDPLPGQELPLITLDGELSLRFNREDIRIIPAPGHTRGDMVVYFVDSGVVCMGDLLFSDTYPLVFPAYGGDVDRYLETMQWLIDLFPADMKYIAGHGRDYSLEELKAYHHMAVSTIDLIKQGIHAGKGPREMVAENLLKDWEKWSSPQITSETWITQVYESVTSQGRKSIAEPLTHTIMEAGVETAIAQYHQLKKDQPDSYDFSENQLNMLGYQLLWRNMNEAAIEVHKLNTQVYPDSANPYDSLGETYAASGEVALAIQSYEKALGINPDMPSAIEALKKLKSES
ncbi:MAG: MBL fold metallo-hydrolase [Anaerolineales bacterium]|nr:MBL fold metallo-hydrolase [Anaerolineales bacterium]